MYGTFKKPWLKDWLLAIKGMEPVEQVVGLWIAYLSDKDGVLSDYTWAELAEVTGLRPDTIRKHMRKSKLLSSGLMKRTDRKIGQVQAIPMLAIRLENVIQR